MSKHAPGPWFINETHCVIYDRDEKYVGQTFKIWLNNKERDEERALANARLIAAAPDLYEALCIARAVLMGLTRQLNIDPISTMGGLMEIETKTIIPMTLQQVLDKSFDALDKAGVESDAGILIEAPEAEEETNE